jgi:amino acid transporter
MSGWSRVERRVCLSKTKRELGLFSTIMMGLGGAIGFEIFVLLDYAYFHLAGPSIILALLLTGVINLLIMLSYCELGAAMPKLGGEYTYIKTAYGGFTAFLSGCFRWFSSVFGAALAALVFIQQFAYLFSTFAPTVQSFISSQMPLIATLVVVVFALLDIKGVKKIGSTEVEAFLVVFAIFIISGLLHGLSPLEIFPKNLPEGLPSVLAATVYTFPMFFGMRALVAGAVLVRHPERNIPRGILLSALIIIPLYVGLAYIAAGVVSPNEVGSTAPFLNLAAQKIMGVAGGVLFAIAGMIASLSALSTSLMVQSSIARGMSRDGYLPKILLSVHKRFGTPYIEIIVGSLFISILSALGAIAFLGYTASFGALLVFALVNLSLLKLRREKPHLERPFKIPLYPFIPIAGAIIPILLLMFPIFLGDTYAVDALLSGLGLTSLVLMTYYLRMIGRYRLQIAVGGICLGTGSSLVLLTCITEAGFMPSIFPNISSYVLLFIGAILIIAGVLNATPYN